MGSRQATGNMFRSLIKPLTPVPSSGSFHYLFVLYLIYIHIPTPAADAVLDDGQRRGRASDACHSSLVLILDIGGRRNGNCKSSSWLLPPHVPLIVGLPSEMRRTTSHLLPSGVTAAGYQRDGKEEKAACSPLCYVPKVNVPQDRAHEFASLFSHPTLHPAAVLRTGNASRLITSVSLTFYPMMDSAAEVSEYPPVSPPLSFHTWAVIMLIGILILLVYPLLSFYPPVVNEAEENEKLSSIPHYRSTRR